MQNGHLPWKKKEQGSKEIDCRALFKDYWDTTAHEFLIRGQIESPTSPFIADRKGAADIIAGNHSCSLELQFSAEVTVRLLTVAHYTLLIPSHRQVLYAPRSINSKNC